MRAFRRTIATFSLALLCVLALAMSAAAQLRQPRPSQKATIMQTIGVTDVSITYSRPGVKGRTIWGDAPQGAAAGAATLDDARVRAKDAPIVPYGHLWRTGANEATLFTVTDDVLINGQKLAAGKYSLHTIPNRDEWTIIFNKDDGQWGSFAYDEKKDALRIKVKPQTAAEVEEWLSFSIPEVTPNTAKVAIRWERIIVPFTVEVPDVTALTLSKARATVAAAKPDDWRTPLQAANYVFVNNLTANTAEAMTWLEQSIKIKETYGNLYTKARVLAGTGKTTEALAIAERALVLGKADKTIDTSDLEKRMAEWRTKKM
ncbi:MAG TPA: DUF2911 domain-containing protein [Pyrinomonadaceae bacterium]|jgi:hypothetical protein|nr:DUF2911 domain-containing protein [Pyrinomonadaceae bacterium]